MKNKLIMIFIVVLLFAICVMFWMQKDNQKSVIETQSQNNEIQTIPNGEKPVVNAPSLSEEEKRLEIIKNMGMASRISTDLQGLESSLGLYSMGHDKLFPKLLSELFSQYIANKNLVEMINDGKILYAYSPDMKKYHIGVNIDLPDTAESAFFKYDKDFNSNSAGYINGFDGVDPIYDLSSY